MNQNEYLAFSSEIHELEALLAEIPEQNVIERIGLESRLQSAKAAISGVNEYQFVHKAKLTFRGRPVFGSYGIAADFAAKAAGSFSDAIAAVAAGLDESLRYMGPIPDKNKNQLLITGTAIGSFGFEFELPKPEGDGWCPEPSKAEDAMQKVQELFRVAAEGSDDEVAELVEIMHPRAVKKVTEFLEYLIQQQAWCGLEFKNHYFKYQDFKQLEASAARLKEDNIYETDEDYVGEIQGVLPMSRTFEFKLHDEKAILKGKIDIGIDNPDIINRDFLHKKIAITLHIIRVGQGKPRYTLSSLDMIKLLSANQGV